MEPDEVEGEDGHEVVNDAIGEITNMSVGAFKNQMCDKGHNCKLTLPSMLRGNNFSVESKPSEEAQRFIHYFTTPDNFTFAVDLIFKNDD